MSTTNSMLGEIRYLLTERVEVTKVYQYFNFVEIRFCTDSTKMNIDVNELTKVPDTTRAIPINLWRHIE